MNKLFFNGVSFSGLLTIVFITLKLLGIINWSWIWVISPIWIPAVLSFLFLIIINILDGIRGNK
jgi:hypothetical protein